MADEEPALDTFNLADSVDSTDSTSENEGTNASRFAILGVINTSAQYSLLGLREEIDLFGFSRNISSNVENNDRFIANEDDSSSAIAFIQNFTSFDGDVWANLDVVRRDSWHAINDGNLAARVALLSAGMCSELERESIVAAVALIGNLNLADAANRWPWERIEQFWNDSYDPRIENYLWPYVGLPTGIEVEVSREEFFSPREWNGQVWSSVSSILVQKAFIEFRSQKALLYVLTDIARMRVGLAQRSQSAVVRRFSEAMRLPFEWPSDTPIVDQTSMPRNPSFSGESTSTIVHGTWAGSKGWWYPGGDFHTYILNNSRPNLYQGPSPFGWNGKYRLSERQLAGRDFAHWTSSAHFRLDTVFSHSYGSEVVACAMNLGVNIRDLVLLSAPINDRLESAIIRNSRSNRGVFDVRVRFDLALLLDAAFPRKRSSRNLPRQRFIYASGVRNFHPTTLHWGHSATHTEKFWTQEGISV